MKVFVEDRRYYRVIEYIDPVSGADIAEEFIGNIGALNDGQFTYDPNNGAYICTKETFDYWRKVVSDHKSLAERKHHYSKVVEQLPEYVGATWIANHIGTTRQNVTKTVDAMMKPGYRGEETRFSLPDATFEGRYIWLKSRFECTGDTDNGG